MARRYSVDEMIACVAREVKIRRKVYTKWVGDGKITQDFATSEIECMEAILTKLRGDPDRQQKELL